MTRLAGDPALREILECLADRIFPADEWSPGARELGVGNYVEARLRGPRRDAEEFVCRGLSVVDEWALRHWGCRLALLTAAQLDQVVESALAGELNDGFAADEFMRQVIDMTVEGVFCDPRHGGNRDEAGWQLLKGMRRPPR
jgi:hypothetical protein